MLDRLLQGMGDVETHTFLPHAMSIAPCTSCYSCWVGKNKGVCVQDDDFHLIYDVYTRCDYFLFATPVYVFGYPAVVKNVIDRFFINLEPTQIAMDDGLTNHPLRVTPQAKGVLLASCGFPDLENFALMSQHFKKWMHHFGLTWAGEVLIPAAGASNVPRLLDDNLDAITQAGRELMDGAIAPETMQRISDVPISKSDYRAMVNASFRGGLTGRAKTISIGMKALRDKGKRRKSYPTS
jgi:multimeric flavodoxin WrbA